MKVVVNVKKTSEENNVIDKDCQVEVKGKKYVLQSAGSVTSDLVSLQNMFGKINGDGNMKEKLVEGWLEIQTVINGFTRFVEGMSENIRKHCAYNG